MVTIVDHRLVTPSQEQVLAHYHDLLCAPRREHFTWVDVAADLRRSYVGRPAGIALGYGENAAVRLRAQLGHYDPAQAAPDSIRGQFGRDSVGRAMAAGRLIDNIIHSSDDPEGAAYEFAIWYGPNAARLLHAPTHPPRKDPP